MATSLTSLVRAPNKITSDQYLWVLIRNKTNQIGFGELNEVVGQIIGQANLLPPRAPVASSSTNINDYARVQTGRARRPVSGSDSFDFVKSVVDSFLLVKTGYFLGGGVAQVSIDDPANPPTGASSRLGESFSNQLAEEGARTGINRRSTRIQRSELRRLLQGRPGVPIEVFDVLAEQLIGSGATNAQQIVLGELLANRFTAPTMIELIWSYWMEKGGLINAMDSIFDAFRNFGGRKSNLNSLIDLSYLRPMSNLIWGFGQYLQANGLTKDRRAFEYDHHYGIGLNEPGFSAGVGADSRSRFIGAFHELLGLCDQFYKEDSNTTIVPDGFPLLNSLREVHLILSEGANNQYGDLPTAARSEMLVMQWMLSRNEIASALRGRSGVPYPEPWMGPMDTINRHLEWTTASIRHYYDLAKFGEQILLSIRFGNWGAVTDQDQATNWARYWKAEIRSYMHSLNAVAGHEAPPVDSYSAVTRVPAMSAKPNALRFAQAQVDRDSAPDLATEVNQNDRVVAPSRSRVGGFWRNSSAN